MADPLSIIGAIDGAIKIIERTLTFLSDVKNAKPEMDEVKKRLEITVTVAENSKKYLTNRKRNLNYDECGAWKLYAEILNNVVEDSSFYIKKFGHGGFLGSAWYATMGKAKFTKLLQNLENWSRVIDRLTVNTAAVGIDNITVTVNQTGANVSSLKDAVQQGSSDLASMKPAVDQICSDVAGIKDSLSDIKKRVEVTFRTSTIEQRQLIRDDDPSLKNIHVDFKDLLDYPRIRDAKIREWKDLCLKDGAEKIPVLIEKVAVERSRQSDHRESLYKVALELEQLRECHTILKFVGYTMDEKHFLLISDGTFEKTLRDLIPSPQNEDQPEGFNLPKPSSLTRIKIISGVVEACKYLHSANIFHKDIHSSNIYINEETMEPKLTGFTGSRKFDSVSIRPDDQQKRARGMRVWQAPERVGCGVGEYSYKCDVHSIGVLMLEVGAWVNLDGEFQSNKLEDIQTQKESMAEQLRKDLSEGYGKLALSCIHREARDRPIMKEVARYLDCIEVLQMLP